MCSVKQVLLIYLLIFCIILLSLADCELRYNLNNIYFSASFSAFAVMAVGRV